MDSIKSLNDPRHGPKEVEVRPDLVGRLRNVGRIKNWQMAVAEVVTNAKDAISVSGRTGAIEVEIIRETNLMPDQVRANIQDVVVRDDGVGFTHENFLAFCTPDSLHKQSTGGKGVGRITCLQAFRQIEVTSNYQEDGEWLLRTVVLQCEPPCIVDTLADGTPGEWRTAARLVGLLSNYQAGSSKSLDEFVAWLSEHFIGTLVEKPTWLRSIIVRDGKEQIDLTSSVSGRHRWTESFEINKYQFEANCYEISENEKKDMVRFVASGRVVPANTRELEFYVPHLLSISDTASHSFLIKSSFFDEHINDARNGVPFSEDGEDGVLGVSAAKFREALGNALKTRLTDVIAQASSSFKERVSEVVRQDAPYYRPLLSAYFESREFKSLSRSSKDDEILASIDSFKRRDAQALKRESKRLAQLQTQTAGYWESARSLAASVDVQKKVALAEYVSLRKIVLDRLQQLVDSKTDTIGQTEEAIHNLIFPMRNDTESQPGADHQLWIVDERLESHDYLASDQPIDGKKGDRPDLLALDRVGAFGADPNSAAAGYERIVLVEFKKALRDLVNEKTDELPHRQMMRYALQITQEKARFYGSKRPIKVTSNARYYMYAVCDMSKALLERLERDEHFIVSPSGDGAFAVAGNGSYYMEYISLPKLLEDAIGRNRAFFQRLGLDT